MGRHALEYPNGLKWCNGCRSVRDLDRFAVRGNGQLMSQCRDCVAAHGRKRDRSVAAVELRAAITDTTTYQDTGCQHSPSCLNCPRDICIEDESLERPSKYFANQFLKLVI